MSVLTELVTLLRFDHLGAEIFPGRDDTITDVRQFIADQLEPLGFPAAVIADTQLAASELATNAVRYSRSRGGHFAVWLGAEPDRVRVTVIDDGPLTDQPIDLERCGGMGIGIVGALATAHGSHANATGSHTAWFEIDAPLPTP
jgi:anti-sigma regulatory factor (Ser/Thr protein kinase)